MGVNPELLQLAQWALRHEKTADDPGMMGGQPAPAPAPPAGQDPSSQAAAMGGQQPGQMMGPVTGQPMPGMMPQMAQQPGMDPNAAAGGVGAQKPKKLDPAMLDQRLYSIQVQLTAIMNHLGIQLPPEAIVMPPAGAPPLTPDMALQGAGGPADAVQAGQQDPNAQAGASPGGAPPAAPATPAGPAGQKTADEHPWTVDARPVSYMGRNAPMPPGLSPVQNKVAALAAMSRAAANRKVVAA